MKLPKPEKRGLPGISFLYLIIGLVIFGLIAINIVVNLVWMDPFAERLKENGINYELSEAKRAAESIEKSIEVEMKDIKRLSQDIVTTEDPEFFINRFLKENPTIKEASIIDLDGWEQQRYSREKYFTKKELRNFSFLEEFEKAKEGETFISKVDFTEKGEPFIKITTPIRKSEIENPQSVLRVMFHLSRMWEKVLEMRGGKTGRVSVIDDKGMLAADPNPSRVLKKINLLTLPPTKPLIRGEIFKGAKYLNEKGIEVMGVGAPIKSLRWGVIVEQDVSELEAPVKEIEALVLIFLIAGIILIGILAWLVLILKRADTELIRRHGILEIQTNELAEAKATLEVKVEARTRELKELAEGLDEKVKEKTKELQERIGELEKFQKLTVGRELKMVELKKEIKKLKEELGRHKEKYE